MIAGEVWRALALCTAFAITLIAIEILSRKTRINPAITRRAAHVASGLFSIYMWREFSADIFILCSIILTIFICISHYKNLLISIHDVGRRTYGEVFLPIGILISYLISADIPQVFIASILILTLADAGAGIIGDIRKKQHASRLGSLAFFIIAFSILLFCGQTIIIAAVIAFVAAVIEKISPYGSDNITIPITVAVLLL